MASGASKYLESLEPVAYYTFDTSDTMEVDGVYYFFNTTPYNFPFLNPISTSVYNDEDFSDPTSYSLSIAEKIARYRSYVAGKTIRRSYKEIYYEWNSKDGIYERKYRDGWFNSHTKPVIVNQLDEDTIDLFQDEYTIVMQIQIQDTGGSQSLLSLYQETVIEKIDEITGEILQPVDLNNNPIDLSTTRIFPVGANVNRISSFYQDVESFRFLDVGFVIENNNGLPVLAFYNPSSPDSIQKASLSISLNYNEVYSISFTVSIDSQNRKEVKVNLGDRDEEYIYYIHYPFPPNLRNMLKLGFESKMGEQIDALTAKSYGYRDSENGTLTPVYVSKFIPNFDNFAIFNRALTVDELRRYNALNYDMKSLYQRHRFTELYDFNQWYDAEATNHIQDNDPITSIIGTGTNKSLRPRSDDPYTGFTVKRYLDGNIEYSLNVSKKSMLFDMPYFHYYTSDQYRFVKNEGFTISFFFKTTDMNGLLYSYARGMNSNKNIMFYFKNGILQLWLDQEVKKEFSGYNNGDFHHFVLSNYNGGFTLFLNGEIAYLGNRNLYDGSALKYSVFGNGLPRVIGLEFELALLAYAPNNTGQLAVNDINRNSLIYESTGIITLNNIRVGTTVLIYDHHSGRLLERLKSSDIDGVFRYTNRYPYTITVVVNDDAMLNGRSYIVSPVEIK